MPLEVQEYVPRFDREQPEEPESFSWAQKLRSSNSLFVPAHILTRTIPGSFVPAIKKDVHFQYSTYRLGRRGRRRTYYWFAKIEKVLGLYVLAKEVGSEKRFLINFSSQNIYPVGHEVGTKKIRVEPTVDVINANMHKVENDYLWDIISDMEKQDCLTESFLTAKEDIFDPDLWIGGQIEVLNHEGKTINVGLIERFFGYRMQLFVSLWKAQDDARRMEVGDDEVVPMDIDGDTDADDDESQKMVPLSIDQRSSRIYPVRFASLTERPILAPDDYNNYARSIAFARRENKMFKYGILDVPHGFLHKKIRDQYLWRQLRVGDKFELIDHFDVPIVELKVASIRAILHHTDGYIMVSKDGKDQDEEAFPVHISDLVLYPVGYAQRHGLELAKPDNYGERDFDWEEYLRETGTKPVPAGLLSEEPSAEVMSQFKEKMMLEAADQNEPDSIYPAFIRSIHGRILRVGWIGKQWTRDNDQLYDIESHDLLPVGWCETYGHVLQNSDQKINW